MDIVKNHAYAKELLAGLVDPVTGQELPDPTSTAAKVGPVSRPKEDLA